MPTKMGWTAYLNHLDLLHPPYANNETSYTTIACEQMYTIRAVRSSWHFRLRFSSKQVHGNDTVYALSPNYRVAYNLPERSF